MDTSRIVSLLSGGVEGGVFPGAAFAFGTSGAVFTGTVGRFSYDACSPLVEASTLYDLASLTKVIVTTTSAMAIFQDGALNLDAMVQSILPGFEGCGKDVVTIRHLLTHQSGLPGIAEYWRCPGTPDERLSRVLKEVLVRPAGERVEYSCVGFLVLQQVLQALTGERYSDAWTWPFFRISGAKGWNFCFNPPQDVWDRCAPTEVDPGTGVSLVGKVHDENARSLGGMAGNAGLFGTVGDVAGFAQLILRGGEGFLSSPVLKMWTTRQTSTDPENTRALGWDTRSLTGSSAGTRMGVNTFGHLGFTGTSLWIDLDHDFFAVLLTNRVHPSREGPLMLSWRSNFADLAWDSLSRQ